MDHGVTMRRHAARPIIVSRRWLLSPIARLLTMKKCFSSSATSTSSEYDKFIGVSKQPNSTGQQLLRRLAGAIAFLLLIFFAIYLLSKGIYKYRFSYDRSSDVDLLDKVIVSEQAAALPRKGEILCWAMTSDRYHDTRALAVNETWLSRCDHGVFFTNKPFQEEQRIPFRTVFAGIPDVYENLFYKSRYAFYYISEIMKADFDWFVKADDDTYLIMENLRKYLKNFDPNEPYYLGYRLKPYLDRGYNAGGAGYVLSRKALELFVKYAYYNETACPDDIYEDVGIGRCLASLGIYPHKTINEQGQQLFNTNHPMTALKGYKGEADWMIDPLIKGYEGIPLDAISFHKLSDSELRIFEILLYRVKVQNQP